jgi:hypothetical protein
MFFSLEALSSDCGVVVQPFDCHVGGDFALSARSSTVYGTVAGCFGCGKGIVSSRYMITHACVDALVGSCLTLIFEYSSMPLY